MFHVRFRLEAALLYTYDTRGEVKDGEKTPRLVGGRTERQTHDRGFHL